LILRSLKYTVDQFNGGGSLETLAVVKNVVFDKTGTLTRLEPVTSAIQGAAMLAAHSEHPVARAVSGSSAGVLSGNVVEHPGQGLVGADGSRLGSAEFVGGPANDNLSGNIRQEQSLWYRSADGSVEEISIAEIPVDGARRLADGLRRRGLAISIVSGDREPSVRRIARELGIASFSANVSPEDKLGKIRPDTLFVGDGINDAAAMSAAAVSASPCAATDISRNAADILLATPKIDTLLDALDIARSARRLIVQNLLFAAAYNIIALPVALLNGLTPLVAAVLMSSSSILVMLNAMRLGTQK